jgi:hypothetical protein
MGSVTCIIQFRYLYTYKIYVWGVTPGELESRKIKVWIILGKKLVRLNLNQQNHCCDMHLWPSLHGKHKAKPWESTWEITKATKGWRCGSINRMGLVSVGPKVKSQYCQREREKRGIPQVGKEETMWPWRQRLDWCDYKSSNAVATRTWKRQRSSRLYLGTSG